MQATRLNSGGFAQGDEGGFHSPASGSPQDVLLSTPSNNFDGLIDTGAAMSGRSAAPSVLSTMQTQKALCGLLQFW